MKKLISTTLLAPRPMELGKIKIGGKGEKRKGQNGDWFMPVRYDHFEVTTRRRGEDENYTRDEKVHEIVGDAPTELDVRLMFDEVEENFQSQLLIYKGQTKLFECDGETGRNCATGKEAPCTRAAGGECKCKPFGRLAVILEAAPTYGGFYLFRTTSWESIANIQSTLQLFREQFGSLRGLPLRLVVYPATGEHGTNYKVGVVLRIPYEDARTAALAYHQADQIERKQLKLLAAGVAEAVAEGEDDEAEEIEAEFVLDPEHAEEVEKARESVPAENATRQRIEELRQELGQTTAGKMHMPPPPPEEPGRPDPEPEPEEEGTPKERLTKRYFALLKDRFPHPGDDSRRHEWQEYVTGKASTKKWTVADFERAIEALGAGEGFELWATAEVSDGDLPF